MGQSMWYVIQTEENREDLMLGQIAKALEGVCPCELFVPKYICKWKHAGTWQTNVQVLFPGYLFLDFEGECCMPWKQGKYTRESMLICAERKRLVLERLREFAAYKTVPVCIGGGFYPIRPEEQAFLEGIMTSQHVIENSVGDIVGGNLIIHTGPLQAYTGLVTRINRHKCIAELQTSLWGTERTMRVGLEVLTKSA